ncbi:MAG: flagellar hook-basal body complex protein, partial [Pseudomonadota bacterium]
MRALSIAATGMAAQQTRVEVISNNLANMNTTGYNARRAEFADLHYQQATRAGSINSATGAVVPAGVQIGLGVRPTAVAMEVAQGTLQATGGDLDIAIEGRGYLEITLPSGGAAYTRDGAMKRTGDGLLVTSDGHTIVPDITIPDDARSITINPEGGVYAYFIDQVEPEQIGQLTLVGFSNEKGLEALGSNLYAETGASGAPL